MPEALRGPKAEAFVRCLQRREKISRGSEPLGTPPRTSISAICRESVLSSDVKFARLCLVCPF